MEGDRCLGVEERSLFCGVKGDRFLRFEECDRCFGVNAIVVCGAEGRSLFGVEGRSRNVGWVKCDLRWLVALRSRCFGIERMIENIMVSAIALPKVIYNELLLIAGF